MACACVRACVNAPAGPPPARTASRENEHEPDGKRKGNGRPRGTRKRRAEAALSKRVSAAFRRIAWMNGNENFPSVKSRESTAHQRSTPVLPVPVQMWAAVGPVPAQMWEDALASVQTAVYHTSAAEIRALLRREAE